MYALSTTNTLRFLHMISCVCIRCKDWRNRSRVTPASSHASPFFGARRSRHLRTTLAAAPDHFSHALGQRHMEKTYRYQRYLYSTKLRKKKKKSVAIHGHNDDLPEVSMVMMRHMILLAALNTLMVDCGAETSAQSIVNPPENQIDAALSSAKRNRNTQSK